MREKATFGWRHSKAGHELIHWKTETRTKLDRGAKSFRVID